MEYLRRVFPRPRRLFSSREVIMSLHLTRGVLSLDNLDQAGRRKMKNFRIVNSMSVTSKKDLKYCPFNQLESLDRSSGFSTVTPIRTMDLKISVSYNLVPVSQLSNDTVFRYSTYLSHEDNVNFFTSSQPLISTPHNPPKITSQQHQ